MKRLFSAFMLLSFLISFLSSCSNDESKYETRYSADGKDSIVYVHYRDDNGQYQDFFMNYLLFRSLYGNGGYIACHNYYVHNPAPRINNYHTYIVPAGRSSNTSTGSSSNSKSWYNTSKTNTGSSTYKSPTRSSPSYSSPSRH